MTPFLRSFAVVSACFPLASWLNVNAADPVFSGPQPGERTTPFKVVELTGTNSGTERNPVEENQGAATALVFVHGIERSLVPLLRAVDSYGASNQARLKTEIVFLSGDRLEGERRVKAAAGSLKLQGRVGLSLDGAEGPGNYGLNKECLMTILAARDNRVAASFALVQPGIADAPQIIAALAKVSGDTNPPTADMILASAGRGPSEMRRGNPESAEMKKSDPFPGAVPTDAKLQGLLRRFIRPTNDVPTVDALLIETKSYIAGNAELTQQAIDGWTRVLHFGDRYGNEYSRKVGSEFLKSLKSK